MDTWDQKKLEEVVQSKSQKQPPTDIVCKYFLEAIESSKYGWFWECPNGGTSCKYRHALPPGFVLKSKNNKADEKEEISLEEFLESEVRSNRKKGSQRGERKKERERKRLTLPHLQRHKLGPNQTPVTLESFTQWKKTRLDKKEAEESVARKAKENRVKAGRSQGMSGRDLFDFNPALAQDYDDEEDAIDFSAFDRAETEKERERLENEKFLATSTANMSLQGGTAAE